MAAFMPRRDEFSISSTSYTTGCPGRASDYLPPIHLKPRAESAFKQRVLDLLGDQKQMISRDWLISRINKL